jgi:transcriptional regulator with XRE-family HTH domain
MALSLPLNKEQARAVMSHQAMSKEERAYCKALGARVAQRRKDLGLTQAELAESLGVAQQTYGGYEVGRNRIPVSLLPALAHELGIEAGVLLGIEEDAPRKRGPAPKLQRYIEQIGQLPKDRQQLVLQVLELALTQQGR